MIIRNAKFLLLSVAVALISSVCYGSRHSITLENDSDLTWNGEFVSVCASELDSLMGDDVYRIVDGKGNEVAYQRTHNGAIIFAAEVKPKSQTVYYLEPTVPATVDTVAYGRLFPERKDDLAWENDRAAYRAYGPALQASGERAFGYDIWTKSVPYPVLEKRYYGNQQGVSYHVDHGEGMDAYSVGPTLGGGTSALLDEQGGIVYPYCFETYDVLDNGPLRFTVRLKYGATMVNADSAVVETRVITLDKGSWLNKTVVRYNGLTKSAQVASGIVVHRQNPDEYLCDKQAGYMAYADSTDNVANDNGVIFVGTVLPDADVIEYVTLDDNRGDAIAHILAKKSYENGEEFTYWWGSGWSKGGVANMESWSNYLKDYADKLRSPLKINIK